MGKRSGFSRRPMDDYQTTDPRAVRPLVRHLRNIKYFAEPCSGDGRLRDQLKSFGLLCVYSGDIKYGEDAFEETAFGNADAIINNPPWTRAILHPMILHFQKIAPTWLLFDADWCHTKQAVPFLDQCSHIVSVGCLCWFPETKQTGKDNCAWHRFHARHNGGPRFYPQMAEAA